MITLYGIANCDTVRKARRWLTDQGLEYRFHDYRQHGLEPAWLAARLQDLGWETLVNRRSRSWRELPADQREQMNADTAAPALLACPALIRRPVLDTGQSWQVGFCEQEWSRALGL